MDFLDVQTQITDLPSTFKRFGFIFAGLIQSFSAALARGTTSMDQLPNNINMNFAKWGWLDAIGKLYGILRNPNENNNQFRDRLLGTLTATRGTPQSIVNFLQVALNLNTSITENFDLVSYQLNFSKAINTQTLQKVAVALQWVRPVGVPFLPFFQLKGGLYLSTLNYFRVQKVTGSYLGKPSVSILVNLAANTNSPEALLPTTYLADPWITGTAVVSGIF